MLARRTNGDFLISMHWHVSETALVQMMRSLRALDPGFEMSLEMAGNITRHLSRQDTCLWLALRALSILERANEWLFMINLDIYDRKRPPTCMLSQNLLNLAELDLAGKDVPTAHLEISAAAIENLVSVGQNRSMRLYFLALPEETDWPAEVPENSVPLDEGFDTPGGRWLSIIYEAAFAIQCTLYHHGFVRIDCGALRPFQRFVYPVTPQNERPSIFRFLSTAEIGESPDLTIIRNPDLLPDFPENSILPK